MHIVWTSDSTREKEDFSVGSAYKAKNWIWHKGKGSGDDSSQLTQEADPTEADDLSSGGNRSRGAEADQSQSMISMRTVGKVMSLCVRRLEWNWIYMSGGKKQQQLSLT